MTISPLKMPYLRGQRNFPNDALKTLSVEIDRAYIDIADKVNLRTIGIFPVNNSVVTGERWYLEGSAQAQQTLRQVYTFTGPSPISPIPHGLNLSLLTAIVKIYGTFTDGTFWYPLPYVDVVNANNQINVIVETANIVITTGAGTPPAITTGYVVLEWLADF